MPQLVPSATFDCEQPPLASQLPTVQALPSSQLASLAVKTQPDAPSQLSSVQSTPSSHVSGVPVEQVPSLVSQVSTPLHMSVSAQSASLVHSTWQLPDPSQRPASPAPSVHGVPPATFVDPQPPEASQLLAVQSFESSQAPLSGVLLQSLLSLQMSTVQPTESSQAASTGVNMQPALASQVSVVQPMPSSQAVFIGVAVQPVAAEQESAVQATPSSQAASSGVFAQAPTVVSQVSVVQATPSSHSESIVQPVTQVPDEQVPAAPPTPVQSVPSATNEFSQPDSVQLSAVHELASSHTESSKVGG